MPLPFIAIAAGVVTLVGAGATAVYSYLKKDDELSTNKAHSLGTFVIWGRPNVGKTTFIARLRGEPPKSKQKTATTSRVEYKDVHLRVIDGVPMVINRIIDMPGTDDRLNDWLALAVANEHIFYLVDLSRLRAREYASVVRRDLEATVGKLRELRKSKRINIICSHVDESDWKSLKNDPNLGNIIQSDDGIRYVYESLNREGVAGYFYFSDLTDNDSFKHLLKSIVNDCHA
ncbi:GTPase [Comamonas sp. MYb69]|uniref:GTPase n=1 Tax=Comamonas sp. MYb69 TaxID=1848650 RepID=UPI0030A191C2